MGSSSAQTPSPRIPAQIFSSAEEIVDEFDISDKIDVEKAEQIISQNIFLARQTRLNDEAIQSTLEALRVFEQLDNLAQSEARISSVLRDIISESKLARARLADEGITRDMIASFLIEQLSDKLIATSPDEKQILDISVQINENYAKLKDPRYTLGALFNRARTEKKLGKDIRLFEAVLRISNELIRVDAADLLEDATLQARADEVIEKSIELLKSEDPEKALILAERMMEVHSTPDLAHTYLVPFGQSFQTAESVRADYFSGYASMDEAALADAFETQIGNDEVSGVELVINLIAGFSEGDPVSRKISVALTEALARQNQLDLALFTSFWAVLAQEQADSPRDLVLKRISMTMSARGRTFPALEAAGRIRTARLRNQALEAAAEELADSGYALAVKTTAEKILDSLPEGDLEADDLKLLADLNRALGTSGNQDVLERIGALSDDETLMRSANSQLIGIAIDRRDVSMLTARINEDSVLTQVDRTWAEAYRAVLLGDVTSISDKLTDLLEFAAAGKVSRNAFGSMSALGAYVSRAELMRDLISEASGDLPPAEMVQLLHGFVKSRFEADPKSVAGIGFVSPVLAALVSDPVLAAESHVALLETFAMLGDVEKTDLLIHMSDGRLAPDQVLRHEATAYAMAGSFKDARALAARIKQPELAESTLVETLKIEARTADLKHGARQLKDIQDFRLRTAAYRSIAEWSARDLDKDGLLSKAHPPAYALVHGSAPRNSSQNLTASGAPAVSFSTDESNVLRAADNTQLLRQESLVETAGYPGLIAGLDATSNDVKGLVPMLPRAGPSGLSVAGLNRFARLNRFSSKFFEEVVGMSARDYLYKRQGTINPIFLYLTEGVFTVENLLYLSVSGRFRSVDRVKDGYIFRAPIVVGPDATLVLSGQEADAFYLSQNFGSFIVNAGKLFVVDTTLGAFDETSQDFAYSDYENRKNFRPFILSWSDSETYVGGSRVVGLGYSAGKSYGLSLSSGPKDSIDEKRQDQRPFGIIADSSFDNMLYGFYSYEADDVAIAGNEYRNSITYGLDPHDRSRRLTMSYNTGYDTQEKHGGIISREVDDSFLVGNVMFDNAGSGLMVDRDSMATTVYANSSFGNEQDGLTYFESPCALIDSNHFFDNKRAGIKARNSWDLTITRNQIGGNAEAAIDGYISLLEDSGAAATRDFDMDPYIPFGSFYAANNELTGNNVGIKANGLSAVTLRDNQFIFQRKGLYGGNLKDQSLWLLKYGSGEQAITILSNCVPKPSHHKACALHENGMIASHAAAPRFATSDVADYCLGDKTSVQAGAVSPVTN